MGEGGEPHVPSDGPVDPNSPPVDPGVDPTQLFDSTDGILDPTDPQTGIENITQVAAQLAQDIAVRFDEEHKIKDDPPLPAGPKPEFKFAGGVLNSLGVAFGDETKGKFVERNKLSRQQKEPVEARLVKAEAIVDDEQMRERGENDTTETDRRFIERGGMRYKWFSGFSIHGPKSAIHFAAGTFRNRFVTYGIFMERGLAIIDDTGRDSTKGTRTEPHRGNLFIPESLDRERFKELENLVRGTFPFTTSEHSLRRLRAEQKGQMLRHDDVAADPRSIRAFIEDLAWGGQFKDLFDQAEALKRPRS